MSKKSRLAYEAVFDYIENNLFKLSNAASFTTDYEVAMRAAIATCNPHAMYFACHFHFTQACKRRASQIEGFVSLIRSNTNAESIYYRLLSLPLLPVDHIAPAFNELHTEARSLKNKSMNKFIAYYRRQWILKVIDNCFRKIDYHSFIIELQKKSLSVQEGPHKICVNSAKMRTTSSVEAYNCQLNKVIVNKGNLFNFIHDLRGEEFLKREEMREFILSGSGTATKRRTQYVVSILYICVRCTLCIYFACMCMFTSASVCIYFFNGIFPLS